MSSYSVFHSDERGMMVAQLEFFFIICSGTFFGGVVGAVLGNPGSGAIVGGLGTILLVTVALIYKSHKVMRGIS